MVETRLCWIRLRAVCPVGMSRVMSFWRRAQERFWAYITASVTEVHRWPYTHSTPRGMTTRSGTGKERSKSKLKIWVGVCICVCARVYVYVYVYVYVLTHQRGCCVQVFDWSSIAQSVCEWPVSLLTVWCLRLPSFESYIQQSKIMCLLFDSKIACLCIKSIKINNSKYMFIYMYIYLIIVYMYQGDC